VWLGPVWSSSMWQGLCGPTLCGKDYVRDRSQSEQDEHTGDPPLGVHDGLWDFRADYPRRLHFPTRVVRPHPLPEIISQIPGDGSEEIRRIQ
jgi:hypothetical protein